MTEIHYTDRIISKTNSTLVEIKCEKWYIYNKHTMNNCLTYTGKQYKHNRCIIHEQNSII